MPIIYRTAGPWGAGKGGNLVAGEVDGNFYDLDARLTATEDTLPELVSIAFFEVSGSAFYIHMSDGTIQGPFALPQLAWNFRGEWTPSTGYQINDVVTFNGAVYMVLVNHVSTSGTFNPDANDGNGHPYYGLLLSEPTSIIPRGGYAGQYLYKISNADYGVAWRTPIVFPAQALREAPDPTYTLTLDNIASYVRCTNASGCSITIPNESIVGFPFASEITFRQCTASSVILQAGTTVIFNTIDGFLLTGNQVKTARTGAVITAKKIGPDTWDVFGLLST